MKPVSYQWFIFLFSGFLFSFSLVFRAVDQYNTVSPCQQTRKRPPPPSLFPCPHPANAHVGIYLNFVVNSDSKHVLDEAERSMHDALCVLTQTVKETRTVPGGGCTEIAMAAAIDAEVISQSSPI